MHSLHTHLICCCHAALPTTPGRSCRLCCRLPMASTGRRYSCEQWTWCSLDRPMQVPPGCPPHDFSSHIVFSPSLLPPSSPPPPPPPPLFLPSLLPPLPSPPLPSGYFSYWKDAVLVLSSTLCLLGLLYALRQRQVAQSRIDTFLENTRVYEKELSELKEK